MGRRPLKLTGYEEHKSSDWIELIYPLQWPVEFFKGVSLAIGAF